MTVTALPRFADFAGQWHVERHITDRHAQSTGRFEGIARFTPDNRGFAYHESGHLHLPGHAPFVAERRYHWRLENGEVIIDFEDGRFFHSIRDTDTEATHWCDPDHYVVRYDFTDWPNWSSRWTVSGPRKAYEMITRYSRAEPDRR